MAHTTVSPSKKKKKRLHIIVIIVCILSPARRRGLTRLDFRHARCRYKTSNSRVFSHSTTHTLKYPTKRPSIIL